MLRNPELKSEGALVCFFLPPFCFFFFLSFFNPCVSFHIEWLSRKKWKRDGREELAPSDTRPIKAHNIASIGKWGCLVFLIALETVCTPRWIEKVWTEWRLTLRISHAFAVMKTKDRCDEKNRTGWKWFLEIYLTSRKFRNFGRRTVLRIENVCLKYNERWIARARVELCYYNKTINLVVYSRMA